MITVVLNNLKFHAHHGVHEEESITGTGFEVDAEIRFPETGAIESIDDTVDYTVLYRIIQDSIHKKRKLLETVAMEIAERFHESDKRISYVKIRISKNAPVTGFSGKVGVHFEKEY